MFWLRVFLCHITDTGQTFGEGRPGSLLSVCVKFQCQRLLDHISMLFFLGKSEVQSQIVVAVITVPRPYPGFRRLSLADHAQTHCVLALAAGVLHLYGLCQQENHDVPRGAASRER